MSARSPKMSPRGSPTKAHSPSFQFRSGSSGASPKFGDPAEMDYHGAVMSDLNTVLDQEAKVSKEGQKVQYTDELVRDLGEIYSPSPSKSHKRKARALEGSMAQKGNGPNLIAGESILRPCQAPVKGSYLERDGEPWYKIANYDRMPPFFMSIVSDTNFWMFISTSGSLTAGRVDAGSSLFPYYTVDKIHDSSHFTGSATVMHVTKNEKTYLWEPFKVHPAMYNTSRNVYKNMLGNRVEFEEVNEDLQVSFSYTWCSCDRFGLIRKCKVNNLSTTPIQISLLDGIQNIMPANVNGWLQDCMANLVDAYKWSELLEPGIGLYCLFAGMSDRAEAVESLKATVVWQTGLPNPQILLSSAQLDMFRAGGQIEGETLCRGQRGAFLAHSDFTLHGESEQAWVMIAEVGQDHGGVAELQLILERHIHSKLNGFVEESLKEASVNLKRIMGAADGFQCTEDSMTVMHHYANVMFNVMRGGIFVDNYNVEKADLLAFMAGRNLIQSAMYENWLEGFPDIIDYTSLIEKARAQDDGNLTRLCMEYIPVTFSRRHGDPSRPWNKFSIVLKDESGKRKLNYQGNWRDIFQNWEALAMSYPNFIDSMLAKFVNATTIDGYNPYVVNKADGINWECPEPDNEWATIGYWGDHQIIYLLKFLEWSVLYHPKRLEQYLNEALFSYANVPYDYLPWPKIIEDSKTTIDFNIEKNEKINSLVEDFGTDGKLVLDNSGQVYLVTLCEKLLIPILSKASNLVVEGGIWLNTQRPEWNDANNAIVGNGLSMVTLYYMRRYTEFMTKLFTPLNGTQMVVSEDVSTWMMAILDILKKNEKCLDGKVSDQKRREILDAVGTAASDYRWKVYRGGFGEKLPLAVESILDFMGMLQKYCDHSIAANRTEDGLYHAYNILVLGEGTAKVEYLYRMLEGQVSALSSMSITGQEAVEVFDNLYKSEMYRFDQHSFTLYPDRKLKGFMEKNRVPDEQVHNGAVQWMLEKGHRHILYKDASEAVRWGSKLCNAKDLKAALQQIPAAQHHWQELLVIYEETFKHREFTGRSGTMFGFEGLGCIYWHMVSKLLLAAQELCYSAVANDPESVSKLRKVYFGVRDGIGFNKSPEEYGAFPCDPYSHTPGHAGAQQPGMTGQVKEEVITRWGELGLRIVDGSLNFKPQLLRTSEFLKTARDFEFVSLTGELTKLQIKPKQLAFTYCQVPIIFTMSTTTAISATTITGVQDFEGDALPADLSADVFSRRGIVTKIEVNINSEDLC